jgi:cell division protein FtsA
MPKGVVGIDLGSDTTKVVVLESMRGVAPRVVGVGVAPAAGVRKGSIVRIDEAALALQSAMEHAERSTGMTIDRVHVGVGGIGLGYQKSKGLIAISRADKEVSKEDVRRALSASEANLQRSQNREILHSIPLLYCLDNETFTHDPAGLTGTKLEASTMFMTLFLQHARSVFRAVEEAGFDTDALIAGPLAVSQVLLSKREKEAGVMVLNIGATTTTIIIFEEGLPYSLEVLPYGSSHITHDIAVGFQVAMEEADRMKLEHGAVADAVGSTKKGELLEGSFSKKKFTEIIEARLGDIFELVEKHLKKVERTGLLPAGIVLTGGGSYLSGIDSFAKDYIKLPVRIAETPLLGGFKEKVRGLEWHTAIGVALMALEHKSSLSPLFRGRAGAIMHWLKAFLP